MCALGTLAEVAPSCEKYKGMSSNHDGDGDGCKGLDWVSPTYSVTERTLFIDTQTVMNHQTSC